jgi:RNA polymerase sigma factor (sigma-70 family)
MNMALSGAASLFETLDPADDEAARALASDDFDGQAARMPDPPADAPPRHRSSLATAAPDGATLAGLIMRVVDRDQAALAALYDATSARAFGLVLRITQRRALAEEVLADTYWQVWRQAPRFDAQRGAAITWLLAIARSRAIDALRRNQCFQHGLLDDAALAECRDDSLPHPQDLLDAARGNERLHAALEQLGALPRQLIALAFFRGMTHDEIAAHAALPLGTVKSLIRRSLQQLRRLLESADADASI